MNRIIYVCLLTLPCSLLPTVIDECVSGTYDCHPLASCTNTVGSYTCTCNNPYVGDGKSCTNARPAGEYFKLIVFQFCRFQRLELRASGPLNVVSEKQTKTSNFLSNKLFYFVNLFSRKAIRSTNSWMVHLSGRYRKIWTTQGSNQNSLISSPYWKDCYGGNQ